MNRSEGIPVPCQPGRNADSVRERDSEVSGTQPDK